MFHKQTNKLNTTESGNTGEHFVVAELSKQNYIATRVDRNTKKIDILACNQSITKFAGIQVKTSQNGTVFRMNKKHEEFSQDKLFYIFVNLNLNNKIKSSPDYYVVKAIDVVKSIKNYHAE
jgi:Holliday junction resolvase-like predicted endonuclease